MPWRFEMEDLSSRRGDRQRSGGQSSCSEPALMTSQSFEHKRLVVYRRSINNVAWSFAASQSLERLYRHARDQWLRSAQWIPLNIAE